MMGQRRNCRDPRLVSDHGILAIDARSPNTYPAVIATINTVATESGASLSHTKNRSIPAISIRHRTIVACGMRIKSAYRAFQISDAAACRTLKRGRTPKQVFENGLAAVLADEPVKESGQGARVETRSGRHRSLSRRSEPLRLSFCSMRWRMSALPPQPPGSRLYRRAPFSH